MNHAETIFSAAIMLGRFADSQGGRRHISAAPSDNAGVDRDWVTIFAAQGE